MSVFVIRNSEGLYLKQDKIWNAPKEEGTLFYAAHRDGALNQLLEVNSQDIHLRAEVVSVESNAKGRPIIPDEPAISAEIVLVEANAEDAEPAEAEETEVPEEDVNSDIASADTTGSDGADTIGSDQDQLEPQAVAS